MAKRVRLRLLGRGSTNPTGRRVGLFALIGVAVMLIGAGVLYVGIDLLSQPIWLAYTAQVVVAFNLSFLLNDALTWGDRKHSEQMTIGHRWLLFIGGRALSAAATTALFALMVPRTAYLLAHFLSIGIVAVGNYIFNDRVVFPEAKTARSATTGTSSPTNPSPWWKDWKLPSIGSERRYELAVVLPVKGNEGTVVGTVESLLAQDVSPTPIYDYDTPIQLIVVVDREDLAYQTLREELGDFPGLEYIHPDPRFPIKGRDANYRRALGVQASNAKVIAMVDADMIYPPGWAKLGLEVLETRPDVGVVLGSVESAEPSQFWQSYVDNTPLGAKTPRWSEDIIIDAKNFGVGPAKPGVTANLFVRTEVLERVGLPRPDFIYTYDDYAFLFDLVQGGETLLCTPCLTGKHFHRNRLKDLYGEYISAGQGCGDFVWAYPESRFSAKRLAQLGVAIITTVSVGVGIALEWRLAAGVAAVVVGALTGWCAVTLKDWKAVLYPPATLALGIGFSYGFIRGLLRGGPPSLEQLEALDSPRGVPVFEKMRRLEVEVAAVET